jgi:hypothetical protein
MTPFTPDRAALVRALLIRIERKNPGLPPAKTPYRDWMSFVISTALLNSCEHELLHWAVKTDFQAHTQIDAMPEPLCFLEQEAKGTGRKQARDGGGWKATLAEDITRGLVSVLRQGDTSRMEDGWARDVTRLFNMSTTLNEVYQMIWRIQWEQPARESRISEMESTWPYESASETREEYLDRISAQRAAMVETDEA